MEDSLLCGFSNLKSVGHNLAEIFNLLIFKMNLQFNSKNNLGSAHGEVVHVDSKKVSCDGGKDASGHLLVYLNVGANDAIVCPYCSKYFTIKKSLPKTTF